MSLIKKLEEDDYQEGYTKLKNLFKKKIKEVDTFFNETRTRSDNELDVLFEHVIFYITSQEPRKPALQKLSWALSNQVKSVKLLDDIVHEATGTGAIRTRF